MKETRAKLWPRLALLALALTLSFVAPPPHDAHSQGLSQPLNNATSSLAQSHTVGSGTLVLQSGHGARFGTPSVDAPVRVTVSRQSTLVGGQIVPSTARTIFLVTARSSDTLSGLTAVEGTSDQAFAKNDPVSATLTAGMISELQTAINSVDTDVTTALEAVADKADDVDVVHVTGNESVAGTKTFTTAIAGPGSAITVTPTGATTASTLATRLGITLDAKADFGATGDGTTDDGAALRAGVAAIKAAGGGCLRLPKGTYVIKRPIVLASYVTLEGLGRVSKITRPASTIRSLSANAGVGGFTVSVSNTSGYNVGDAFSVWDDESWTNSFPTTGIITSVVANTSVTIDTALLTTYNTASNAKCGNVFALVNNEADSQGIRVTGLALDGNKQAGDSVLKEIFQFSLVDLMKSYNGSVDHCWLINSPADGYSDQANDWRTLDTTQLATRNRCVDNVIDSPNRHGVHLGTFMDGAFIRGNTIINCGGGVSGGGIFYCAGVRNTIFSDNLVRNVAQQGVVGMDSRDTHNRLIGNYFERCALGGIGLTNSKYNLVLGNTIKDSGTASISANGASDIQIIGNMITADDPYVPTIGLINCARFIVSNNEVQGGASGSRGIETNTCTDLKITNNIFYQNAFAAIELYQITRGQVTNNTIVSPVTGIGIKIYAPNTEVTLDGNQFTGAASAIDWDTIPVRMILNGMGDNGSNNPASAGDWNAINALGATEKRKWYGIRVRWDDGAGNNFMSLFQGGVWFKFAVVP